jgi:hypothetical protein
VDTFVWQPSLGMDDVALDRLRRHFPKPRLPMGEAWFMGEERRFFQNLMGDISTLSAWDLREALEEIASGTSSFGPRNEWTDWYHYLLGQSIPRSQDIAVVFSLLEVLVSGFIALHPHGLNNAPYPEFRHDVLVTLGRSLMAPQCWTGDDIVVGESLHRSNNNPAQIWRWYDASGDFSASVFFCLKYLPTESVQSWLQSVLAISSPHWRAQVLVWLVGAHDLLLGKILWPSEFPEDARPAINWDWSHCLKPALIAENAEAGPASVPLLSQATRALVVDTVRAYFSADVFLDWLDSISGISYLTDELAEIPTRFETMYVSTPNAIDHQPDGILR